MTDQQSTNPDEEIRLDFTTPDGEYLFFESERNESMTSFNDTVRFFIDTSLTPGTVYSYTFTASYYDVTGITLTSLPSEPVEECTRELFPVENVLKLSKTFDNSSNDS